MCFEPNNAKYFVSAYTQVFDCLALHNLLELDSPFNIVWPWPLPSPQPGDGNMMNLKLPPHTSICQHQPLNQQSCTICFSNTLNLRYILASYILIGLQPFRDFITARNNNIVRFCPYPTPPPSPPPHPPHPLPSHRGPIRGVRPKVLVLKVRPNFGLFAIVGPYGSNIKEDLIVLKYIILAGF